MKPASGWNNNAFFSIVEDVVEEGFFARVFLCKLTGCPINPNMLLWPPFTVQIDSS
jgi:hypothetical protein